MLGRPAGRKFRERLLCRGRDGYRGWLARMFHRLGRPRKVCSIRAWRRAEWLFHPAQVEQRRPVERPQPERFLRRAPERPHPWELVRERRCWWVGHPALERPAVPVARVWQGRRGRSPLAVVVAAAGGAPGAAALGVAARRRSVPHHCDVAVVAVRGCLPRRCHPAPLAVPVERLPALPGSARPPACCR